jgi:Flp pilus assembly protein TadD
MIARMTITGILLWTLAASIGTAQDAPPPTAKISGRIFADWSPVDWTVEVRVEKRDGSLVTTAYTSGSYEFEFWISPFEPDERYNLVIREPGYKELVHSMDYNNFHYERLAIEDADTGLYTYSGMLTLELESLPPASRDQPADSMVVDVEQIRAQIPEEARKEYNLAGEDFAKGDAESAVAHLEKVVELAPKYYDAVNRLGSEYLRAGRHEKAESMLLQARKLNSNDPVTLTNLGILYFQKGEKLAAEGMEDEDIDVAEYIDDDMDAEPDPIEALYRNAVEMLEEAVKLDPRTPRAAFYLGTALYRVGDYERAESLLNNALVLDAQLQEARLSLLNIYIRQQRHKDALEQISAYLEANPETPLREQLEKSKAQIEQALDQKELK